MQICDVCVTGGGIIGLSIALELARRGARVTVVERGKVLSEASQAAAGMLAATDPDNPAELADLARLSMERYASFLSGIERLSGMPVPFQTSRTYQAVEADWPSTARELPAGMVGGPIAFAELEERSVDPRQLAAALRAAVAASSIRLLEDTAVRTTSESSDGVALQTNGEEVHADRAVYAMGAWGLAPVRPRKGQMLSVRVPEGMALDYVVRAPEVYIVPRLHGPRAGQAVIGATVEDAGFSRTTDAASLAELRARAARYLPRLAEAEVTDQWAGLRPDTPDHLPLMGWAGESRRTVVATGHYRNGILLAPGTAEVVASLLEGRDPGVNLEAFSPWRFA